MSFLKTGRNTKFNQDDLGLFCCCPKEQNVTFFKLDNLVQWPSIFSLPSNNLEDFLKPRLLVPNPRTSQSRGVESCPIICFLNKLPSKAAAVDPGTIL